MIPKITEINFPEYATLSQATVTINDMGERTITARVKIDGSIVPDFSFDWAVEFKGERYIQPLRQPQAGKNDSSASSFVDLTFHHWAVWQMKRYYFVEMTSTESGTAIADQYIASLGLNLPDFCSAFNRVLSHYFGDTIKVDLNPQHDIALEPQYMSISYSYIWDVLQKVYEVYGVRWDLVTNEDGSCSIRVGYPPTILSHTFQYGYDGGLLSIERQVQDSNIRNSLLGRGGEQNLPAYYFKEAPEGSLFASDPDAIPELANIYFSNLRGKTFRDYVKGWKAKRYGGTPMAEPTEAYTKGYTDKKFNPVEYVNDNASIDKYGLLQGALDNNEDIYPSIKGAPNGEDVVVYVEPVTSDDVEQSVGKAETIALGVLPQSRYIGKSGEGKRYTVTLNSADFEVPEDNYALNIGFNVSYDFVANGEVVHEGATITHFAHEHVYNRSTGTEADKSSLSKGTYYVSSSYTIEIPYSNFWDDNKDNTTLMAIIGSWLNTSLSLQLRKLQDGTTDKWLPTFNIWVKNIWGSTRNSGENDLEYAERVWRPILGDRQGNEAKVVFSSGWLSGHEDYEFTIVDFAYDNTKSYEGSKSEWRLTLAKSDAELDATGKYIPSASTNGQAHAVDTFFFIGIDMPYQYVLWAEERLDNFKTAALNEVSEIQPKWVVRFDKLRLHEGDDNLAEQIAVGGAINIADVRFIDTPALQLYLQSVTYTWNEQTLLYPDIEVVLADTIVPVQSPVAQLQGSIDAINSQLYNIGNVAQTVRKIGDSLYLRKDGVEDTSKSPTKFVGNVSGHNFRRGKVGGADWGIYRDEHGNAIAEFDKIIARKDLEVNNLVINQVSYVGGMQITSAASLTITRVIESDAGYQCFFDQKGGSVANLFAVNDIAYSQRFNEENNTTKYYKRVVTEVGLDYITLSKTNVDGDGEPMSNDVVIHYGNTADANRQYVIIKDIIGGGYERMLSGLNSVSATGVEYYFAGRTNGNTPRWFVGDKSQQYIEYKDGHLQINADVTLGAGSSGLSELTEFKQIQDDIAGLQNQIDGKVEAYYLEYDPSVDEYPTNEWTTDELKEEHLNDTFTNINSGQSWRWLLKDGVYQWVPISDTQALAMAQEALNVAKGKVTIFTEQPTPPYKVKDLWFQGENGNTKRCVTARTEQESFNAKDWVNADDYKDFASAVAGEAEDNAKGYAKEYSDEQMLTVKYLKDAFGGGTVLEVNGITLAALVGVKDGIGSNAKLVAGLYGGASPTLNEAGYEDAEHGTMLLFGGIEGAEKPKTYKTAIFADGYIESEYFATARAGARVEMFDNQVKIFGSDGSTHILMGWSAETGNPELQYVDANGARPWLITSQGISNAVTLNTEQKILAVKNFDKGLKIGGLHAYKSQDDTIYLDCNLVVRGAVTMYGMNTTTSPSIFNALPIDGKTIGRNERGELYVIGDTSGGGSSTGGLDYELLDRYLTTNGYATQSWVTGRGYITSSALEPYALKASIPTNTNQLTNGAGFITASAIPTSLKNPNALSWSGYSTGSYDGSTAQNIALPTKLSQLTDDVVSGKYLPLTGGTISGNLAIGGATALDKLHVYGAISSENANADAGFRARGSTYALFFGIGSGNVNRGIYDDYHKEWWIMRSADKTTTIGGSMVASGLRINQSAFNNGLTLNRTSANAGAGIVFQSNGNLLGQIGINGMKTFEVSDGTTIKASIEIPTGNLILSGAITMYYSSDKRLKQNIRKVDASETLLSLGGVYQYEYIDTEVAKNSTYGGSHFGLIYQNVKGSALDKMCFEREDGMGALNYLDTNFISLIAGATMENCTEIEKLKKENKALRKRVEQLEKRVA